MPPFSWSLLFKVHYCAKEHKVCPSKRLKLPSSPPELPLSNPGLGTAETEVGNNYSPAAETARQQSQGSNGLEWQGCKRPVPRAFQESLRTGTSCSPESPL